jgi:hypothetical protein
MYDSILPRTVQHQLLFSCESAIDQNPQYEVQCPTPLVTDAKTLGALPQLRITGLEPQAQMEKALFSRGLRLLIFLGSSIIGLAIVVTDYDLNLSVTAFSCNFWAERRQQRQVCSS